MTFQKYVCKACFKLFAKDAALGILTDCPHCKTPGLLSSREKFERPQGAREIFKVSFADKKRTVNT